MDIESGHADMVGEEKGGMNWEMRIDIHTTNSCTDLLFTASLVSLTASHPNVSASMAHGIAPLPIKHSHPSQLIPTFQNPSLHNPSY